MKFLVENKKGSNFLIRKIKQKYKTREPDKKKSSETLERIYTNIIENYIASQSAYFKQYLRNMYNSFDKYFHEK